MKRVSARGLGWIDGKVRRFDPTKLPHATHLPHMGWNDVRPSGDNPLMNELSPTSRFYFLHSYYFECSRAADVLAVSDYGGNFACAVNSGNIYGVQFHPEKESSVRRRSCSKNFADALIMLHPRIIPCSAGARSGPGQDRQVRQREIRRRSGQCRAHLQRESRSTSSSVLDIDASAQGREPDYKLIGQLAAECRMPLCYGGGIRNVDQARRIIGLGVEKVAMSSAAVQDPGLIAAVAREIGRQSVVVVLDVKKRFLGASYEVYLRNGKSGIGEVARGACAPGGRAGCWERSSSTASTPTAR